MDYVRIIDLSFWPSWERQWKVVGNITHKEGFNKQNYKTSLINIRDVHTVSNQSINGISVSKAPKVLLNWTCFSKCKSDVTSNCSKSGS